MKTITSAIGKRIRVARQQKGWSQRELAEKADVSDSYIGSIERGKKVPSIEIVYRICAALSLSMQTLFDNILPDGISSEMFNKIYDLVYPLPEKEQAQLLGLIRGIIEYKNN